MAEFQTILDVNSLYKFVDRAIYKFQFAGASIERGLTHCPSRRHREHAVDGVLRPLLVALEGVRQEARPLLADVGRQVPAQGNGHVAQLTHCRETTHMFT